MTTERRAMPLLPELREDAGKPVITGYAARFNSFTMIGGKRYGWREVVRPGAFTRALAEDDVRALFNHDVNQLLGRKSAGTLRLAQDEQGLRYEIDPPDTETGRSVVQLLRRKDLSGSSFGFSVRKDAWTIGQDGEPDQRELLDVALYDVGPVTFPAYEEADATVRSVRSRADELLGRSAAGGDELGELGMRLRLRRAQAG